LKIVLFGCKGQLGWELQRLLTPLGELCAVDREELDLQDMAALEGFLLEQRPKIIVNASAYTAVDRAEQEQGLAFQINERAPRLMAGMANSLRAAFVHISTDYVFDGELGRPYMEGDATHPLNVYGQSKLAGEQAIQEAGGAYFIFRTAWVYSMRGDSFVTKVLAWARKNEELRIVDDQVSNPTWSRSLAEILAILIERAGSDIYEFVRQFTGLYHLGGWGVASRFDWAQQILAADPKRDEQLAYNLLPARTEMFPTPARRPLLSALDCKLFETTFGLRLPDWEQSLKLALNEKK
jgi:dTDP-4-dehydrorhamnose reductase